MLHTLWHLSVLKTSYYHPHCKVVAEIALKRSFGLLKTRHILQDIVNDVNDPLKCLVNTFVTHSVSTLGLEVI